MNAAGRLVSQSSVSKTWVLSVVLARMQMSTLILTLAVLTSALSMVYITNVARGLNANLQQSLVEHDRLQVQWGQLLLEKSTLTMQARVQQTAENKLDMVVPDSQSVVIINE